MVRVRFNGITLDMTDDAYAALGEDELPETAEVEYVAGGSGFGVRLDPVWQWATDLEDR